MKQNSLPADSEAESVSQFFHILGSVDQQRGCCEVAPDKYEITIYTSCCNADKGIYYYNTYEGHQINAVDMNRRIWTAQSLPDTLLSRGRISIGRTDVCGLQGRKDAV